MALTRKMLKAMGIEDEKIDQIIDAHTETVDALKEERDNYKANSDELESVKKQLKEAKETIEKGDKDAYKVKYEALKEDFDNYKEGIEKKEVFAKKTSAMQNLLKEIGISEKRIPAVMKVTDLESLELDSEGKIKDRNKIEDAMKAEWSDFIVKEEKRGADVSNPQNNDNAGKDYDSMTDADYYKAVYEANKK